MKRLQNNQFGQGKLLCKRVAQPPVFILGPVVIKYDNSGQYLTKEHKKTTC